MKAKVLKLDYLHVSGQSVLDIFNPNADAVLTTLNQRTSKSMLLPELKNDYIYAYLKSHPFSTVNIKRNTVKRMYAP